MARPKKNGLDYFPFDVDFFSNRKIKRLRAAYGSGGGEVYLYLLCEIYRNGYYTVYDSDLELDIAATLSMPLNTVKQIMNYLFSRSLLEVRESKLAEPVKAITAASVQRRFQAARKGAKRDFDVAEGLWVLAPDETESFIKVRRKNEDTGETTGNSGKNSSENGNNTTKESREKESKANESKPAADAAPESSALEKLEYDYGSETAERYIRKVRDWYTSNGRKCSDIAAVARTWLERDGVPLYDHSMDKYMFVMNRFDL